VLPFRLLRVALEAELLRLSHHLKRNVSRVVLGCFAMALMLLAFAFAHIAIWFWLRISLPGYTVAAIFAGADLVLALVLALLAMRSTPGQVEVEALAVRQRALSDVASSMTVSALVLRVFEMARSRGRSR